MSDMEYSQDWIRDRDEPCISLGPPGAFDDCHIFAPFIAYESGEYKMWYSGSQGEVADRVFRLGLATSTDGVHFSRQTDSPVLQFSNGSQSVLTPTLLRYPDGSVLRESGKLRMWFSSCDFPSRDTLHTLHEVTSEDGISWTPPSEPLLENVYAPTVIKEDDCYRMWFTDVEQEPWRFKYAVSFDGVEWSVDEEPVLALDQEWEHQRLFYPTVLKRNGKYLMWYGSYSNTPGNEMTTALGFATSTDGTRWEKDPGNPVFGPEPKQGWESHYTTSQSILQLPDGSLRIWYASRPKPPFVHKYFAIGTARVVRDDL